MVVGFGLGLLFVPVVNLATGSVDEEDSGLASGLMTTCQQVGAAVGIAILVTIATGETADRLAAGTERAQALVDGFSAALEVQAVVLAAAALIAATLRPGRYRDRCRNSNRFANGSWT